MPLVGTHDPLFAGPYHRLTRPRRGAWWRLVVGVAAAAGGFVVAANVGALIVIGVARFLGYSDFEVSTSKVSAGGLLALNLGLALLVAVAGALTVLVYQVRPRWVSSLEAGIRWGWLTKSMGIAGAVWLVLFLIVLAGSLVQRSGPIGSGVIGLLVVVVVTQPLQAAGEEYLFRGYLLQSLGATRLPTWLCCGLSAVLFATAHLQFAPPAFADRFLLGAVLAWLALRTGGLEAPIAIHTMKNVSILIPSALAGDTGQALQATHPSWVPFAIDVVLLAAVSLWLRYSFDRREHPRHDAANSG